MKYLTITCAAAVLLSEALFSQVALPVPTNTAGVINGSQTPDLIPDNIAYRMVFSSLMLTPNPTPLAVSRQGLKLQSIGLTAIDVVAMRGLMAQFSVQYGAWRSQVRGGTLTPTAVTGFEAAMDSIVQQSRTAMAQQITADGASKFLSYVQGAKRRMVVRPQN